MIAEPSKTACLHDDIAAYLDGELSAAEAAAIEDHVRACSACSAVLREQRQFLASISATLSGDPGVGLPANFAAKVIAAAENRVTGLRTPNEQFTAIFISASLLLFSMFGLGAGFGEILLGSAAVGEKILAVLIFSARAAGNVLSASAVVVRSLFAGSTQWVFIAVFPFVLAGSLIVSQRFLRSGKLISKN